MSSLPSPNLDDRSFDDLVADGLRRIASSTPAWTDLSAGDPGIVLLELFAYLTELMLYRLNQVPDKSYVEFLRLMNVTLEPPAAAGVRLTFSREADGTDAIPIPAGTVVSTKAVGGSEPVLFMTAVDAVIESGAASVDVIAYNCAVAAAEGHQVGEGAPAVTINVASPPIVAPTGADDDVDLRVWIGATPEEAAQPGLRDEFREFDGRHFRVWREVEGFADLGEERHVYMVDRVTGTISFAPALRGRVPGDAGPLDAIPTPLAEVPATGSAVRVWYRHGGGAAGNVAAKTLTELRSKLKGVKVFNPTPATGGRDVETLANAMLRGPQELHSPRRAVTADDFEAVARHSSGAVARALAITRSAVWRHAAPGTVEVVLVPSVEPAVAARPTITVLHDRETDEARSHVAAAVAERSTLGVTTTVTWARYKSVRVRADIVVHRSEDREAVKARLLEQLHLSINPLPSPNYPSGWGFGQPLRASHVYDILLRDPGVRYAENVELVVDEVPGGEVLAIAADHHQGDTWYAACGERLFRSMNNGVGWEVVAHFPNELVEAVRPDPVVPGAVAVASRVTGTEHSAVRTSSDCGETWTEVGSLDYHVEDLHWMQRPSGRSLLLATDKGLYEVTEAKSIEQLLVDRNQPNLGFYAVTSTDVLGVSVVAVAAQKEGGIYISSRSGDSGTFLQKGLTGEDIRVFVVEEDGPRRYLWAGAWAAHTEPGHGCFRWEVRGHEDPPDGWVHFDAGWAGSSCRALAVAGKYIFAASYVTGVLRLDPRADKPHWEAPLVNCGLPMREVGRFQPVLSVASDDAATRLLAGGPVGIRSSDAQGLTWEPASEAVFRERVTLPPTWLFCSGEHEIDPGGAHASTEH
jgi:hypothetical protein